MRAWLAWHAGDEAAAIAHGRRATDIWWRMRTSPMTPGRDEYPFQWIALLPLMAVRIARHEEGEMVALLSSCFSPNQEMLSRELEATALALQVAPDDAHARRRLVRDAMAAGFL